MVSILFCVRASLRDGLGHLVRTLAVIREIRVHPFVHLVILGDGSGKHLVADAAVQFTRCETDEEAASVAESFMPRIIVFDMLRFDGKAIQKLVNVATLVSLSPQFDQMNRVHYLFHRTTRENPEWRSQHPFPEVYKGLQYTVLPTGLRRVSTELFREHLAEERLSVAISMGGSDAPNVTLSLLRELSKTNLRFVIWVALGDAYAHSFSELLECAANNRQEIILLKSNESMWRVLRNAALVLCAGGLTTYEAAYVGVPTINLIRQHDWQYLFEELVGAGASFVLPPSPQRIHAAVSLVVELNEKRSLLLQCHESTIDLIPDGGAKRIATSITSILTEAPCA